MIIVLAELKELTLKGTETSMSLLAKCRRKAPSRPMRMARSESPEDISSNMVMVGRTAARRVNKRKQFRENQFRIYCCDEHNILCFRLPTSLLITRASCRNQKTRFSQQGL
jgi:hypothetical protein